MKPHPALLALALLLAPAGCGDEDGSPPQPVTLEFVHQAGGQDLVFDQLVYTTALGDVYSVETLRYYVSVFGLHPVGRAPDGPLDPLHGDGTDIEFNLVHYVDAGDPATHRLTLDLQDVGTFNGLSFDFGLNEAWNHSGSLPDTPENTNMAWPAPMGGGYHFMKLEGRFIDAASGDTLGYALHLGRCETRNNHFSPFVPLPNLSAFDRHRITLAMDLNQWFTNPNDCEMPDQPVMGDCTKQRLFSENGWSLFSVLDIETTAGK